MLKATLLKSKPDLIEQNSKSVAILLKENEYSRCKEVFSISKINSAMEALELKYKMVDEVDIYNIIEHILINARKS